jgi:oligopeptidase B
MLRGVALAALFLSVFAPGVGAAAGSGAVSPELQPPRAAQRAHTVTSPFGNREDPWYWLRDDERKNPEMLAYLEAENEYLKAVMAPHRTLEQKVYEEIVGRLKQDDASVPQRRNGYWYYTRYETGKQYPIFARRKGNMQAPEEIVIDGNQRAQGHDFYQLAGLEVSVDGRWAAIAEDTVGRRQYEVRIKDLGTGEFLPQVLTNVEPDLAWANDHRTLFYIRKDPQTLLGNKVYRHVHGTDPAQDALVYEQDDESFYMGLSKSKSDRFIFIAAQSTVSSEYRYADANDPKLEFRIALPRERDTSISSKTRATGSSSVPTGRQRISASSRRRSPAWATVPPGATWSRIAAMPSSRASMPSIPTLRSPSDPEVCRSSACARGTASANS